MLETEVDRVATKRRVNLQSEGLVRLGATGVSPVQRAKHWRHASGTHEMRTEKVRRNSAECPMSIARNF